MTGLAILDRLHAAVQRHRDDEGSSFDLLVDVCAALGLNISITITTDNSTSANQGLTEPGLSNYTLQRVIGKPTEPSIEEVLGHIRRIVEEDGDDTVSRIAAIEALGECT